MNLREMGRLTRTVRHLQSSQLLWRGRYALQRRLPPPHIRLPANVDWHDTATAVNADTFPPVPLSHRHTPHGTEAVRRLIDGEFAFLNRSERLGQNRPDWRLGPQSAHRLWAITLHYHHWMYDLAEEVAAAGPLSESASGRLVHYVGDWIERCDIRAAGARQLAWNAFAVATRIGWWIRAYGRLGEQWWRRHLPFRGSFLKCLWRQAEFLANHLEWDLRANHLLRDLVGLAWSGRFFAGREPRRWLQTATSLSVEQAREQVLADGGHFERSPMYHVHVMEDILSLALLLKDPAARTELQRAWLRMADYLSWMRHPDGEIPLFNDAAQMAVSHPEEMLNLAGDLNVAVDAEPRQGGRYFADSGMVVWHGNPFSLFFDVGQIGPDYQPGHAHADTLSIECSVDGRRLIVDPGTYGYDNDVRRRYDRSTSAHNTVCIDGVDSSEVWHIFRVGSRARPLDVTVDSSPHSITASAAHDGYDHLPGRPRHSRMVFVEQRGSFTILDRIAGSRHHEVEGGYLLAPEWTAQPCASGWNVSDGNRNVRITLNTAANVGRSIERRPFHPQYGLELDTTRLTWRWRGTPPLELSTRIDFSS